MSANMQALQFLCDILFNFLISLTILRFMLPFSDVGADNPIVQFVIRFTNPVILPLRKILPPIKRFDTASLSFVLLLAFTQVLCLSWIFSASLTSTQGVAMWTAGLLLKTWISLYFYLLLGYVIGSWFVSTPYHPGVAFLGGMIAPLLRPFQRLIPSVGGFDLAPLPVIICLQLVLILLANPLTSAALMKLA